MIEIVVNQKNKDRDRYSFDRGTVTIGRSPDNEIHLDSPEVSDKHARISLFENNCLIQKLASTDSLMVNDEEVQRTRLYNQDVISIGHFTLTLLSDRLTRITDAITADGAEATMAPADTDRQNDTAAEAAPSAAATDTVTTGIADPDPPLTPGEGEHSAQPSLLSTGVDVLTGPAHGKRILFTGRCAKLGLKDEAVVVIKPTPGGYEVFSSNKYLMVTLNGRVMGAKPTPLSDGDMIDYANLRSRFFVEPG